MRYLITAVVIGFIVSLLYFSISASRADSDYPTSTTQAIEEEIAELQTIPPYEIPSAETLAEFPALVEMNKDILLPIGERIKKHCDATSLMWESQAERWLRDIITPQVVYGSRLARKARCAAFWLRQYETAQHRYYLDHQSE